ncbi:hypothetical protein Taro_006054 [Colocasia esculenta]|uniref:Uncharacterized protein n=1 Tax=Colocasia esculenta TaxID=4460 RepID=A0A843TPZ0_COLES|nr:hypothetical protein [Colocasia esculenta]
MRGECPELKKKLKKEKFTFKKVKAMLATWSDEDEDEDAQASSGDEEIHCLMARSEDSTELLSTAPNTPVDSYAFTEPRICSLCASVDRPYFSCRQLGTVSDLPELHAFSLCASIDTLLHSNLLFLMAPKGKHPTSHRRPLSSEAGEGSGALVERRSKHRDDRLPKLIVPPNLKLVKILDTLTKFVQPRYVDFVSLEDMFPGEFVDLKSRSSFDLTAAHRMSYKLVDGKVTRDLKGKEQVVEEEDFEDEESGVEVFHVEPMDAQGDEDDDVEDQTP